MLNAQRHKVFLMVITVSMLAVSLAHANPEITYDAILKRAEASTAGGVDDETSEQASEWSTRAVSNAFDDMSTATADITSTCDTTSVSIYGRPSAMRNGSAVSEVSVEFHVNEACNLRFDLSNQSSGFSHVPDAAATGADAGITVLVTDNTTNEVVYTNTVSCAGEATLDIGDGISDYADVELVPNHSYSAIISSITEAADSRALEDLDYSMGDPDLPTAYVEFWADLVVEAP